jgi:hypothetical protein
MSAKLVEAIGAGKIVVQRKPNISGEVVIQFKDPDLSDIRISGAAPVEVTKNVEAKLFKRSNLKKLVQHGFLSVV